MFRSDTDNNDRAAIRARQRAYLESLDAQTAYKAHASAEDRASDGKFVRNLPATPDQAALLAPLPPVNSRPSPRKVGKGLKDLASVGMSADQIEVGRRRYGKAYESGVGAALNHGDNANHYDDPASDQQLGFGQPQSPNNRKNFLRNYNQQGAYNPANQQGIAGPPRTAVNLDYANNNALLQAAVSEQLNKFNAIQQRSDSTLKYLSEQVSASHTKPSPA